MLSLIGELEPPRKVEVEESRPIELSWTTRIVVKRPTEREFTAEYARRLPSYIETTKINDWTDPYECEIIVTVPRDVRYDFYVQLLEGEKIMVQVEAYSWSEAENRWTLDFTSDWKTVGKGDKVWLAGGGGPSFGAEVARRKYVVRVRFYVYSEECSYTGKFIFEYEKV